MAEVAVTIRGQLYDLYNRTTQQVVLQGQASLTGLSIGGGPIYPEGPPTQPPDSGAHPEHPIYYPPTVMPPIYYPPGTGPGAPHPEHPIVLPPDPGWPGGDAHPEHPIVLPPPNLPTDPPTSGTKPPPPGEAGWGYYDGRWGYFPGPGEAGPKR